MVTTSTRFSLDKYSAGEDGWSHSDLVDHVDEYSVGRDTKANRPASGDYDNQLFLATDEPNLYRWDDGNSQWVQVTSQVDSDTQSGDGTTTTFTITHALENATPAAAAVTPESAAAAADFYVSNKTASNVELTYTSAPANGTDNLSWTVVSHP